MTQLGQTFTAGSTVSNLEKTYYFTSQYQLSGLGSFSDRSSNKLGALGVIVLDTTCAGWTNPSSAANLNSRAEEEVNLKDSNQ